MGKKKSLIVVLVIIIIVLYVSCNTTEKMNNPPDNWSDPNIRYPNYDPRGRYYMKRSELGVDNSGTTHGRIWYN